MKTTSNSSPLAACTVINCTAVRAFAGLMLAGLQRGVGQEGRQRPAIDGCASPSPAGRPPRSEEGGRGVDQFVEVLEALLAFLFGR
jgi:hypothetical protein